MSPIASKRPENLFQEPLHRPKRAAGSSWIQRALFVALCSAGFSTLHAASPTLSRISPRGGQRGTEVTVDFHGSRLGDAQEILFYSPGFETLKLGEVKGNRVRARIKIAPDCRLGVHSMRVRTATGISDLRTFFVGALPAVAEKEPNSEFAAPQTIGFNSTVHGVVENEDVDYYAFPAAKGQRISAEIEAMRLGVAIFDPYIAILDAKRFELAASDDTALLLQDAACQAVAPEDGTYYVAVRETSYGGNGNCHYRLHVGTFPRPTAMFPAGGRPGEEIELSFIGDAQGLAKRKVRVPEDATGRFHGFHAEDAGGIAPSANVFRVSELQNVLEVEPDNRPEEGTRAVAPGAWNGVISQPGDVDCFRFEAKKGQVFDVELYGRRLRSPLDSVMRLRHFGGPQIAANDDSRGPDSYFRFTAPETKEYTVSVRDHLRQGGPDYVYHIEVRPVEPRLGLTIPRVARYSQERQSVAVPRGNRFATLVNASRESFGGDLVLSVDDLPQGVTMTCETMPSSLTSVPVLFEAREDASLAGRLCRLTGRHADPKQNITGGFRLGIDLLVGNPGQSVYLSQSVDRLAVAVAEKAPFKLRIVEPKVPLVRSGSMALMVVAERDKGFTKPIRLEMVFNPPGVNSQRGVTIGEGKTEASIRLGSSGGAQIREWKIVVNGVADAGKGPVWVASQFATLRIAQPYLTLETQKGSVEQGQDTELFCKVNHITKFEGKARVQLLGLPHKVSSQVMEVSGETKEFSFPVKVSRDSPAGRHRNIFCRVEILENGEPIVHSTGGTELRIDKPLPPPKPKPDPKRKVVKKVEKPKPEPKPEPPEKRRLTRLEKLRLEYERRRAEADGEGSQP